MKTNTPPGCRAVYNAALNRRVKIFGWGLCAALLFLLCSLLTVAGTRADAGELAELTVDFHAPHPQLACTPAELVRLRAAFNGDDSALRAPVDARVRRAQTTLTRPVEFPPRGARHNQWYQCDTCQTALRTTADGRHQCPGCSREYTGAPYDDVVFGRRHAVNLRDMLDCAWAYVLTDEKKYAEHAALILTGYAKRYLDYPRRGTAAWNFPYNYVTGARLYDQTLSEASALVNSIAPSYDLIHDSGVLSADDHDLIRERFVRPVLDNIGSSWWNSGVCNWQSWHNAAMLWGGVMLKDIAWIKRSLDDPRNGFCFQMENAVTADGMWHEGTWGYHFYALQALVAHAEGARRIGVDLWAAPRLCAMFVLPMYYIMPDEKMPRFGDDVGTAPDRRPSLMEAGYYNLNSGNEAARVLTGALPAQPVWETVLYGRDVSVDATAVSAGTALQSQVFPTAGHVILRRSGLAGLTVALTFGAYGGYHGHLDKLSFVFYGFGRELGVDPGRAASQAYRLPIHRRWYKATLSHNTIIMNGRSQRPCAGKLERFEPGTDYDLAIVSAEPWRGVRHRRLLLLTDDFLLVADELRARSARRFDWLYHNRGTQLVCVAATMPVEPPPDIAGAEYVRNIRSCPGGTTEDARAVFNDNGLQTELSLAGGAETRIITGDGPGRSIDDRVPMLMARREGRLVWFAAIIRPRPDDQVTVPVVLNVERTEAGRLRIWIEQPASESPPGASEISVLF